MTEIDTTSCRTSGSQGALLPLSPLRTGLAPFNASGSSISNARSSRTRCKASPYTCTVAMSSRRTPCLEVPVKQRARERVSAIRKSGLRVGCQRPSLWPTLTPIILYGDTRRKSARFRVGSCCLRSIPIRTITARPSLAPSSFTCCPIALSYDWVSFAGEQQARVPSGCRFVPISVCFRLCLYAEGAD